MARIQGFRVKNFKALRDVTLGRLWNQREIQPLTDMIAVIGKNGVGKSALFDAFGFLADALNSGVEAACDARGRGGFERIRSQGATGPIEFELYYKEDANAQPITYEIVIDGDEFGRPYVLQEELRQGQKGVNYERPLVFLILSDGTGRAWTGAEGGFVIGEDEDKLDIEALNRSVIVEESGKREIIELADRRRLGIAALGALKQHPRIAAFRRFIEGWYLSYFTPNAARSLPLAGPQPHLNIHGDNLGNVVQFMEREHPQRFQKILKGIAGRRYPALTG